MSKLIIDKDIVNYDLVNFFENKDVGKVLLSIVDKQINIDSELEEGEHEYVYGTPKNVELRDCLSFLALGTPAKNFSVALIFMDDSNNRLSSEIIPAGVQKNVCPPKNASKVMVGIRVSGTAKITVNNIYFGTSELISRKIIDSSFNILECSRKTIFSQSKFNTNLPVLIIETVFCDTEKDPIVLDRYFSKLKNSLELISLSFYSNYVWSIGISDDKADYINRLNNLIFTLDLSSRVYLNQFSHPSDGYGNENETHIDKLRRPNSTNPVLRKEQFDSFLLKSGFPIDEFSVVIRVALDDDDFFLPKHIYNIVNSVVENFKSLDEHDYVVFGFDRIYVSYQNSPKSYDIHDVKMSRVMTGCKFVATARNKFDLSPFSISEHFGDYGVSSNSNIKYISVDLGEPSFVYNRHGINLSNSSKEMYYSEVYSRAFNIDYRTFLRELAGIR